MINYRLQQAGTTHTFETLQEVEQFKATNPEWQNVAHTTFETDAPQQSSTVPQSVPLWCLRTILRASNLLQPVMNAIASMPESVEKIAAQEGIEYANTVLRNGPTTTAIQAILQLTDVQVDEIFIAADAVEA